MAYKKDEELVGKALALRETKGQKLTGVITIKPKTDKEPAYKLHVVEVRSLLSLANYQHIEKLKKAGKVKYGN